MNRSKAHELAARIQVLFQTQEEVVLETTEIQEFLSDGEPVDSIAAMETVRCLADEHHWTAFVFDYGALVRFSREPGSPGEDAIQKSSGGSPDATEGPH